MNMHQLIDDYCIWHEVSGHSPKTIAWYRWNLGTFTRWLVANNRPTTITQITVADARAFLQAETQRTTLRPDHPTGTERPGSLSDRTLHCYARSIRAFFNWLVAEEYLDKNPMAKLKPPKLEKRIKQVLTVDEVERLLAHLNPKTFLGSRMYAMVALMYDSGLRAGEVAGLQLPDIVWADYKVKVFGKGKKERLVPFGPATHRALRRYLVLRERFAPDGQDAVFISADGHQVTRDAITHAIKRLGQRVGIPRLHPHLFRHSAALAALLNGASQFDLKRMLGHTQLATTDGYVEQLEQMMGEQHRKFSPMARVNERRSRATERTRKGHK